MAKPLVVTTDLLNQVLQSTAVRQALQNRAALILPRAQQEAAKSGRLRLAKGLRIESGTRPGLKAREGLKRPYARVVAPYPEEDSLADSGARLTAREVLRRASRG